MPNLQCQSIELRRSEFSIVSIGNNQHCYLIIRNDEASLVEIESRDRHYKRIIYAPKGANMNVNSAFFHVILNGRFLRLNSGIK